MPTPANRIIGSDVVVEFLPSGVTPASSVWTLTITGVPTSGGYYLVLNGERTGLIPYDDDGTALQAAFDALNGVTSGDIVVTGSSSPFTVTAAANLANSYNSLAISDVTFDTGTIAVAETTEGKGTVVLTGDYTSFSLNRQVDMADVTAGNSRTRYEKPTIESMDFSISIFDAVQGYQEVIKPSTQGQMWVFPKGKTLGMPYLSFNCVIGGYNEEMPFDAALEIEVTGNRQGDMIADVGSVWAG